MITWIYTQKSPKKSGLLAIYLPKKRFYLRKVRIFATIDRDERICEFHNSCTEAYHQDSVCPFLDHMARCQTGREECIMKVLDEWPYIR